MRVRGENPNFLDSYFFEQFLLVRGAVFLLKLTFRYLPHSYKNFGRLILRILSAYFYIPM